ncbi:phage tail protein [Mangrovivirga sp. M17]|uniref:Phage tail protein n=1 Tax=Mangrovivirga halotolerans TaxID=2993936 RepID=A0ABT3RQ08_9BACT|nr:phage tail protein [Mangrovivirga halotolerans]MCX2743869.1 phage tail protein [Mangrovivirga halotolerans]
MAEYPLPKFHFQIEWGGSRIGFTEVTGLDVETEIIEYTEGYRREYNSLKMPGRQKFGNVTLKRGILPLDNEFFAWWNTASLNKVERRDVTISLLNEKHEPTMTWRVKNAWPAKIAGTDLKADGNEVAVNSIELAHEGISIINE